MFAVIFKIIESAIKTSTTVVHTGSTSSNHECEYNAIRAVMQNLNMLRTPILFVSCFLVLAWTVIGQRINDLVNRGSFNDKTTLWVKCVFSHYDGTQNSWKDACGERPKSYSEAASIWDALAESGNSVLIACIYLPNPSVWRIWSRGLRRLCPTARVVDVGLTFRKRFVLPLIGGGKNVTGGVADTNMVLLAEPPSNPISHANDKWQLKSYSEPSNANSRGGMFTNLVSRANE